MGSDRTTVLGTVFISRSKSMPQVALNKVADLAKAFIVILRSSPKTLESECIEALKEVTRGSVVVPSIHSLALHVLCHG